MCMKNHIYSVLASHRRKLDMSQQELAARAGLRREKLNRIESRHQNIGFEELCRLLDAVGLELCVRERGEAKSFVESESPLRSSRAPRLVPQDFHQASLIDGSKAKILSWGKVPK